MFDVRQVRSREHSVPNVINADLDDFEELAHSYRPSILRYALSSLKDRDLAETVTQDCFLRAFKARACYR
jgi:RNA polymerase sigma-70 factor (ECF subfamily)